mmetsp:Transcript_26901/g.69347  ORF Transcript_26901/g.69347 Transcript_26901/m.69347 type:complete len:203 (-) Transcript_26901:2440-3048(-)
MTSWSSKEPPAPRVAHLHPQRHLNKSRHRHLQSKRMQHGVLLETRMHTDIRTKAGVCGIMQYLKVCVQSKYMRATLKAEPDPSLPTTHLGVRPLSACLLTSQMQLHQARACHRTRTQEQSMPLACQCLAGGGQCWRARLAYLKCHLRCPPPSRCAAAGVQQWTGLDVTSTHEKMSASADWRGCQPRGTDQLLYARDSQSQAG